MVRLFDAILGRNRPIEPEEDPEMASPGGTSIIVGLGNPGKKYENTRHNLGFLVVDELARRVSAPISRTRFRGEISEARRGDSRLILVKPQTYMNESGITVREAISWYKVKPEQVLIVVDDLDIPFGEVRLRQRGSAGGHNGLKSIFAQLGHQDVPRLRIGIGRPKSATISHVLSRFGPEEEAALPRIIEHAANVAELWLDRGVIEAMNFVNDPANQPLANSKP